MHIHLPRPLHGWREFLGEVGIIFIGVLLAIGAEQTIEWLHHRAEVRQAMRELRAENIENRDTLAFDIAGVKSNIQEANHDLKILGPCTGRLDVGLLQPVPARAFLLPANTVWLGLRDGALLPLMPRDLVDGYWKVQSVGDQLPGILRDMDRRREDAAAAVDVLRQGGGDRQSCLNAESSLVGFREGEKSLLGPTVGYQIVDEAILRGQRIVPATALETGARIRQLIGDN